MSARVHLCKNVRARARARVLVCVCVRACVGLRARTFVRVGVGVRVLFCTRAACMSLVSDENQSEAKDHKERHR